MIRGEGVSKNPVFDLQKPEKNTGILREKTGFLRKKTGFSQNRKKMPKNRISGKKTGKMGKYRKTGISDEKGFRRNSCNRFLDDFAWNRHVGPDNKSACEG